MNFSRYNVMYILTSWRVFRNGFSCCIQCWIKKIKYQFKRSAPTRHHAKVPVIGVVFDYSLLVMANGSRISVNKLSVISLPHKEDVNSKRRLARNFFPILSLLIPFVSLTVNTCFSSSSKMTRKLSQSSAKLSIHCCSREFFLPFVNFCRMLSTPAQSFRSRDDECGHPMNTKPAILRITFR